MAVEKTFALQMIAYWTMKDPVKVHADYIANGFSLDDLFVFNNHRVFHQTRPILKHNAVAEKYEYWYYPKNKSLSASSLEFFTEKAANELANAVKVK